MSWSFVRTSKYYERFYAPVREGRHDDAIRLAAPDRYGEYLEARASSSAEPPSARQVPSDPFGGIRGLVSVLTEAGSSDMAAVMLQEYFRFGRFRLPVPIEQSVLAAYLSRVDQEKLELIEQVLTSGNCSCKSESPMPSSWRTVIPGP